MRLTVILILVIFFIFPLNIYGQSSIDSDNAFTENTADSTKIKIYLDTVDHYLFSDFTISKLYLDKCEQLIHQGAVISPSLQREFINQLISYESNKSNHLKAYKILNDNREILNPEDISEEERQWNKYSEGYILFNLGDLESAHKIYSDMILFAKENNIESLQLSALYSLAQIQSHQEDYKNAEKNYLKVHHIEMKDTTYDFATLVTIYELSNISFLTDSLKNAQYYDSLGLAIAKQLKSPIFIFEFTNNMANTAIKNNDFTNAKKHLKKAKKLVEPLNSERHDNVYNLTKAALFIAQNKHIDALNIYENLVATDSKEDINHTLSIYEKIHPIYKKIGNTDAAYEFLLKTKATQDSVFNQKKLHQINFLNTKFEVEQKEKENALLTSQILQKQIQNKYLYALIAFFILGLLTLVGAFFQKQKYNKHLKQEVQKQTIELQNSNKQLLQSNLELEQFNYILSHDLKEPVRSIVGFCTLTKKQIEPDHKIQEYLQYIENSGKQLHHLIEDVSSFHKIDKIDINDITPVDLNELLKSIESSLFPLLTQKKGKIEYSNLPVIQSNQGVLLVVLKNIIENGIKYNDKDFAKIIFSYKKEDHQHSFLIEDNGIGIEPEFHSKIFEMFKRLNDRSKYSGTGLGLSLVKKCIQKIDGNISLISSTVGQGSIFEIRIPVIEVGSPVELKTEMVSTI